MDQKHVEEQNEEASSSASKQKGLMAILRAENKIAAMKQWIYDSHKQIMMSVGGVALLTAAIWGGTTYVHSNTFPYLQVYNGEELVGEIESQDQLEQLYTDLLAQVQASNPNAVMKLDTSAIHTVEDAKYKADPQTEETLTELATMIPTYAEGVQLKVNGVVVGIVKDQGTADKLLAQVKEKYNPDLGTKGVVRTLSAKTSNTTKTASRLESISLRERVAMIETQTSPDQVLTEEEAMSLLATGQTHKVTYTVQEGDTVSSIAESQNVARETIYRNNPNVGEEYLQVGQELDLTETKPLITVKTVEKYTEVVITEPQVEIRYSDEMRAGESKVVREGSQGLKTMSYRLTKDNGMLTKEEFLSQEVVKAAVSKIVIKGTKVVNGEGTGSFVYPVSNANLTSGFGSRWGTTHKGIDMTSSNKTIMASDEGIVEFAGVKNGYGNTIIINHQNGYKTLYGHLSKISVSEGDIVEQGGAIGIMGNTGNSTGTHLHFEIHKDGSVVNPLKYL